MYDLLDKLIGFIVEYLLIIVTILISILGLYLRRRSSRTAERNLEISEATFEGKKAKFKLYLEDSYRVNFKIFDNRKIILFEVDIMNQSKDSNTFSATLVIEYYSETNERYEVILKHIPTLIKDLPQRKLSVLPKNIEVTGKGMVSGCILFEQPLSLSKLKKTRYEIILQDVDENKATIESVLIKDIIHEI